MWLIKGQNYGYSQKFLALEKKPGSWSVHGFYLPDWRATQVSSLARGALKWQYISVSILVQIIGTSNFWLSTKIKISPFGKKKNICEVAAFFMSPQNSL